MGMALCIFGRLHNLEEGLLSTGVQSLLYSSLNLCPIEVLGLRVA